MISKNGTQGQIPALRTRALVDLGHHRSDRGHVSNVRGRDQRLSTEVLDLPCDLVDCSIVARMVERDVSAVTRKCMRTCPSDAA